MSASNAPSPPERRPPRPGQRELRLRGRGFRPDQFAVMAIINRTPDSFYDRGATYAEGAALHAVDRALAEGADIVDLGGVKAGPGAEVDVVEELRRVARFVGIVRARHPDLVISVDTWRSEVARVVTAEGCDLINDSWGGFDPTLAVVAADTGAGLVCTHAGHQRPRTRPHRVAYDDVTGDVVRTCTALAESALRAGVRPDGIIVDPGHDFGKNSWHSLEVTRRLGELVGTGWPVLVALSHKDFIGEALDLPVHDRLEGTLATTAVCAWLGARLFRAHEVGPTRRVLDMVAAIRGDRDLALARRGLA